MSDIVGASWAILFRFDGQLAGLASPTVSRPSCPSTSSRAMDTVVLGRTGLEVSVAGLGCGGHSRLGMARGESVHHAADIVRRALDLGITLIDTARAYGTEEAVGLGVKGRRDQAVISTKAWVGR